MPVLVAVALFAVVGAVAFATLRRSTGTAALSEECRSIQRAKTLAADANERARLDALLRDCVRDLQSRGVPVDIVAIELDAARSTGEQIDLKWSEYQRTDWSDSIKRTNIRNDILGLLDQLRDTFVRAAEAAQTDIAMADVRFAIQEQIGRSLNRAACLQDGGPGCGRFGLNEPDWDERMRDELLHGAFAFGLRDAVESGWRSTRDRRPDLGVTSMRIEDATDPAWAPFHRARGGGNYPPASMYRVGEISRITTPTWDDFGGGPHYPGQYERIRDAWLAGAPNPYRLVKPRLTFATTGAIGGAARGVGLRLG